MIEVGTEAPGFTLRDQFARAITLGSFRGRRHVMLLFYPLDFTPNCSREIPQVEALLARFSAARTQVLGLSVDSIYSHAHWGASLGGVSFQIISRFPPGLQAPFKDGDVTVAGAKEFFCGGFSVPGAVAGTVQDHGGVQVSGDGLDLVQEGDLKDTGVFGGRDVRLHEMVFRQQVE